jgi:protease I
VSRKQNLRHPREPVTDAGAETELLSTHEGEIAARNNDLEDAGTFSVAKVVEEFAEDRHDARVGAATGGASS